jgi:hypothetical protein
MRTARYKIASIGAVLSALVLYLFLINTVLKPNLSIGSIVMGRISSKNTESTLRSYLTTKKITLKSESASKTYSLNELGIFFEEQSVSAESKKLHEALGGFRFVPMYGCCRAELPEMVIDLSRLDYIWQKELAVHSKDSKNAELMYKKDLQSFQVSDAVAGLSFDTVAAAQAIIGASRNTHALTSAIQVSEVSQKTQPEIQKPELLDASAQASRIVGQTVTITLEGTVISPPKETIASWLVLQTQPGESSHVAVDAGRIATYITDIAKKYQVDPVAHVTKSGKVVKQGSNGKRVTNIDAVAKLLQQKLSEETNSSINATLHVVDVPFSSTDTTPQLKQVKARYTYRILSKGSVQADLAEFRSQVYETLSSRNGWPASGATFQEVGNNSDFDIVLTEPAVLGTYSGCSSEYSCRKGRLVMINDERWRNAVSHWNLSLRDYRHMVVNHEVGHWLGLKHRNCSRAGAPAPIMQQQSISLQDCTANPWPTQLDRSALK